MCEEKEGGLRAPLLGIAPLCHSAAPWPQGLPTTSPCVVQAPAPSSSHALGALDKMVARVFQESWRSSVTPPPTWFPTSGAAQPHVQQRLRGSKADIAQAGTTTLFKVAQRSLKELPIAKWCMSCSSPSPGPVPGVWRRTISSALSCEGARNRGPRILGAVLRCDGRNLLGEIFCK